MSQAPHPHAPEAQTSPNPDNFTVPLNDTDTDDDSDDPSPANPNGDGEDQQTYTPKKTFVAIDGIHPSDLDNGDRESLEKEIITHLLTNGYPIEDVRVASADNAIVEVQIND